MNPICNIIQQDTVYIKNNNFNILGPYIFNIYNNNEKFNIGTYQILYGNIFVNLVDFYVDLEQEEYILPFLINDQLNGDFTISINQVDSVTKQVIKSFNVFNPLIDITIFCYCEGTQLLCQNGYKRIEDCNNDDFVYVYPNRFRQIKKKICSKLIYLKKNSILNQLYINEESGLIISGGHGICKDDITEKQANMLKKYWDEPKKINDKYLLLSCFDDKFRLYENEGVYNMYHLILESNDEKEKYAIDTNGILTETLSIHDYNNVSNKMY